MRRTLHILNLLLFLLGVVVIVVVVNFFAGRAEWRERVDATKTRMYSLSPQTRQLLDGLQGRWTVALLMSRERTDRSIRSQIDEVLSRYTSATDKITAVTIDPADPRTLMEYDSLLARLNEIYREPIGQYDHALDAGGATFKALQAFAQRQAGVLEQIVRALPDDDSLRDPLHRRTGSLSLLADQGGQILSAIEKARRIDQSRPISDYETARSVLVQALMQSATDLDELASLFGKLIQRPSLEGPVKDFVIQTQREQQQMSRQLAESADPLKHLPPLELSTIGTELQRGEAALIIGPHRAAIIPSSQLFPKSNLKTKDDGGVSFDQRFRGEQLISAAIRSLTVEHMPLVIFVHAEDQSLLQRRDKQADLVGVAGILKASRFEVAEWMPGKNAQRPAGAKGQPLVWVVVPPPPARSVEPTPIMRALTEAINTLIDDGEPVLLSVSPNLQARYGQIDPVVAFIKPFGLEADTANLIFESVPVAAGDSQPTLGQAIHDFSMEHLIGRAVDGQQAYFGMPVPLRIAPSPPRDTHQHVIAAVEPSAERWIESDWTGNLTDRRPDPMRVVRESTPLVIAADRPSPTGRGTQRLLLVGSGGWMITNVADVVLDVGGGRVALINPGNHELMLASVAWLAGMDDLIAASPLSQDIARLRNVSPEIRMWWMWITVAALPGACVLLGVGVWLIRRN